MKLNGWYRIGIVLSVLWCVFINVYIFLFLLPPVYTWTTNDTRGMFFWMIVPVVVVWLLVFTIKWVIIGFKSHLSKSREVNVK